MKSTKKALFTSVLSLLLCVSMLIGTTFAWFTDSVTSGVNQIIAGNLDVELEHQDKSQTAFAVVNGETKLFDDVDPNLWEPGAVAYENLKVSNKGTLALQYRLDLKVAEETKVTKDGAERGLSQALKVAVVPNGVDTTKSRSEVIADVPAGSWSSLADFTKSGTLLAKAANDTDNPNDVYGIVIYWEPTENDNVFNMNNGQQGQKLQLKLGVTLFATQYTHESDSFNQYYDVMTEPVDVYTVDEFNAAVANAEATNSEGQAVNTLINVMTANLDLTVEYDEAKTITLQGEKIHSLTANIPNGTIHVYNEVGTVNGDHVELGHSAHFYNSVEKLNATAGHFVIEEGATVSEIIAKPLTEELKIEVKGTAAKLTTPENAPTSDVEIQVTGTIEEVVIPAASTKIAVVVEENAVVTALNITDTAEDTKIVLHNSGTISNSADVENKTQEMATIDHTAKTLSIKNASELRAFASGVNAGKYDGYTAALTANINLNNVEWTQINGAGHNVTLDGNNFTISNLKISNGHNAGLFATGSGCTIKNLTVDGANVTGVGRIAVICGHGMCVTVENCTVKNATVTAVVTDNDDGDKAGAVVGYLSGEPNAKVIGCAVENVTVQGYRDIGGLVGYAGGTYTITGNTLTNVTVICDKSNNYKNYTTDAAYDVNEVVGEKGSSGTYADNTASQTTVQCAITNGLMATMAANKTYTVTSAAGFAKLFEAGVMTKTAVVNIAADLDMTGISLPVVNDANSYNVTFNGNNHTISNIAKTGDMYCGLFDRSVNLTIVAKDLTFKNCTFKSNNKDTDESAVGIFAGFNDYGINATFSNITVDRCEVGPSKYVGVLVGYSSKNDSAHTMTVKDVTFKNCTAAGYSAGLIIGHSYVDVDATGIKATDNTISEYLPAGKTSGYPGVYVGTINAGTFTLTATEHSGNVPEKTFGRTAGGTASITEQ